MPSRRRPSRASLAALLLLSLVPGACGGAGRADARNLGYHGTVLRPPRPMPDITLTDTRGTPFHLRQESAGKLTLLFFGYTHCPDVCPVHLANLAAVLREEPELADRTRVVFVTTDPGRDTPERIRSWLDGFDPRFVGLRGTPAELHRLEDALHLPRSVVPEGARADSGDYVVGHAAQVIAFSPDDNRAHLAFPFGTRQAAYATDLPRLLRQRWSPPATTGRGRRPALAPGTPTGGRGR